MNHNKSALKTLAICGLLLLLGIAFRVLVPYYQTQQDAPIQSESRSQLSTIMRAINEYVDQNPEHRFPDDLAELALPSSYLGDDSQAPINRFVYLPPPPDSSEAGLFGRVVLIEKLGHYQYKDGGYGGTAGNSIAGWYTLRDYERFAEESGLSLGELTDSVN